jgi:hypothetical protein
VLKLTPANTSAASAATMTTTGDLDSSTATWGVMLGIVRIVLRIVGIGFGLSN